LSKDERIGRENEQGRSAAFVCHARNARGLAAAVGVHAIHHREANANLIHRHVKNALLLLETAGGNSVTCAFTVIALRPRMPAVRFG
jgi:hypothetical protein